MEPATDIISPRIYVACLASYNNGILHGAWIDATRGRDAMWEDVAAMLRSSPISGAEEYAIHDHEGFGGLRVEEYSSPEDVSIMADFVVRHGALGIAVATYCGGDIDEAQGLIAEHYLGVYPSLADYMQDLTEGCTEIPHNLRFYIDWQAMARDAELNGDLLAINDQGGDVHVFAGWSGR